MKGNRFFIGITVCFILILLNSPVIAAKKQLLLGGGGTAGSWYVGSGVISDIINLEAEKAV